MKYIDYRKKLGIGFNDDRKYEMLLPKVINLLNYLQKSFDTRIVFYSEKILFQYSQEVGEFTRYDDYRDLRDSIGKEKNILGIICKFVIWANLYYEDKSDSILFDFLKSYLDDLNISYQIIEDKNNFFIFPKGAKELDDALVSQPLEWLNQYPSTRKLWIEALKLYADTNNPPTDVADKFRKALENFFQIYFGGNKSLENYKADYGAKLKEYGVPKEIANNFEALLQAYTNFMNSYAKHHDKTEKNVLEYIMYQTGNIIRLLITLKDI